MARGWKPSPTEDEKYQAMVKETGRVIRAAMAEKDITSLADAAKCCGIKESTFGKKLRDGGWTQKELRRVVAVFGIGADGVMRMMGVKNG